MPRNLNKPLHITPEVRDDVIKHLEAVERTLSDLETDDAATLPEDLRKYIKELSTRRVKDTEESLRDTIVDELEGLM